MFPIPFNFPFRKKDGSMTTIGDEISAGGGGGGYTLPTASAETKGGIKIGAGLTMEGEVLNNTNPTPPSPYELPTASAETLGGIKVGSGLTITDGVLSASGGGGGGLDLRYFSKSMSMGNDTPPRIMDNIAYSDVPKTAIILGCSFTTSWASNPDTKKSVYAYMNNSGNDALGWNVIGDTLTGAAQTTSGVFSCIYIVPTT